VVQWVVWLVEVRESRDRFQWWYTENISNNNCPFWKNNCTCVLKVDSIFETSHFLKTNYSVLVPAFRTRDLCMGSLSLSHLSYRGSMLTCTQSKCLRLTTCLIFNPWWIFSPCNMFVCTNKTCFAGVGTWTNPLFRIRISCLSYPSPCESKQIRIFCQQIRLRFPV